MQKKIIAVNMNPCADKTMTFDAITPGGLNRAVSSRTDYSGKGVNVVRVLNALGLPSFCAGISYSDGGAQLKRSLEADGVEYDFVEVEGVMRTNVKAYDERAGIMTELNERGGRVPPESVEELIDKLIKLSDDASLYVLSGSVPEGVLENVYGRIIGSLPRNDVILDADGAAFKEGLAAGPYAVKPNLYELESAFGVRLKTHGEIVALCRKMIRGGSAKVVLVSLGADGAIICGGERGYYSPAPEIRVRGLQGAGDSMVAGMCAAIVNEKPPYEMLRYAMAAAAGSIAREGTLLCTAEGFAAAYDLVKISEIRA